jgi:hypothetical protein
MPNWYHSKLTIQNTCSGFEKIKAVFTPDQYKECHPFQSIIPPPVDLLMSDINMLNDSSLQKLTNLKRKEGVEQKEQKNLIKFGVKDLYDWKVGNWGTKWDACDLIVRYDNDEEFQVDFDSAWSPPIPVFEKIIQDNPNLSIFISMYSWESDGAGWICKDPNMQEWEGEYFKSLCWLESEQFFQPSLTGGERFVELASQFKNPAHFVFKDAPETDRSPF